MCIHVGGEFNFCCDVACPWQSYHTNHVTMINVERISPSLSMGFYCHTAEELQLFLDMASCTVCLVFVALVGCARGQGCMPIPVQSWIHPELFPVHNSTHSHTVRPTVPQVALEEPPLFTIMNTRPNFGCFGDHRTEL